MGVATVTGGGGRAGAGVDCLQPVDKMQRATATQQAGFNNLTDGNSLRCAWRVCERLFSNALVFIVCYLVCCSRISR
jgi:hypothetical protein